LTDKKISIFGFVWFCLAFFGFNGYNLVTVNRAGIDKQIRVDSDPGAFNPRVAFQNVSRTI
jgi:hypothetical protein